MATKPFLSQIAVPVGTTTGDVYYPQTSLLMHFNGTPEELKNVWPDILNS